MGANDMFDETTLNEHETEARRGAVMSAIPADDSEILSLFREWVAAMRAADALPGGPDGSPEQAEYDAACRRCWNLEKAITAIPAAGAAGLAIKIYIGVHVVDTSTRDDDAALSADALDVDQSCDARVSASILRDAVRFAPELAPLTAAVIETGRACGAFVPALADVAEHDPAEELEALSQVWAYPSTKDRDALRHAIAAIENIAPSTIEDPIPALVAERWRHEADASAKYDERDEDAFVHHLKEADKLNRPIDRRVADTVASSAAGLSAQVWLLRELLLEDSVGDDHSDQLFRSIVIGIMRLGGGAAVSGAVVAIAGIRRTRSEADEDAEGGR
jgi:hypothetical protein